MSYEDIIEKQLLLPSPCEAAVFNFCLYDKAGVPKLLKAIAAQLSGRKLLFIQTLHPSALIGGEVPYQDHWIADSWAGLPDQFTDPHAWYFRTLSSWIKLFKSLHLSILDLEEPIATHNTRPASIIFVLQANS